jgi:hypothetical protein
LVIEDIKNELILEEQKILLEVFESKVNLLRKEINEEQETKENLNSNSVKTLDSFKEEL